MLTRRDFNYLIAFINLKNDDDNNLNLFTSINDYCDYRILIYNVDSESI